MEERAKLTDRQQQILDLVQSAIERTGAPPTRAEIAAELGFRSANAAEEHLRALQRKGVLTLMAGSARGIVLKDALREQFGLPLIGRVAAGRPILAEEHIEGRFQIDPALFRVGVTEADYLRVARRALDGGGRAGRQANIQLTLADGRRVISPEAANRN